MSKTKDKYIVYYSNGRSYIYPTERRAREAIALSFGRNNLRGLAQVLMARGTRFCDVGGRWADMELIRKIG
jgi:hypothetical protein